MIVAFSPWPRKWTRPSDGLTAEAAGHLQSQETVSLASALGIGMALNERVLFCFNGCGTEWMKKGISPIILSPLSSDLTGSGPTATLRGVQKGISPIIDAEGRLR